MKHTLMQYFEWYLPADCSLWRQVQANASKLAANGFTALWLPPAYKGFQGKNDTGYGVYDVYDLGEFDQKGSIPTKYGTIDEYIQAIQALQQHGIHALADIVLNHKMGSDHTETIEASVISANNRNEAISAPKEVEVWTKFSFPNRHGKYSSYVWDWDDFTGTDYDQKTGQNEILQFQGKEWNTNVSTEQGNFDYIMGADVDFTNPHVLRELYNWGAWYTTITGVNGFRLDAIKSIDSTFFPGWLHAMHLFGSYPDFSVGEYWSGNLASLEKYLKDCRRCMKLFDVPLHFRLQQASKSHGTFDLRTLFDQTLTNSQPEYACAFVDNHDTQPGQALESWVENWFKPHAYACILLKDCISPCVFYGDYYGIEHDQIAPVAGLKEMVWIRSHLLGDSVQMLENTDSQKLAWYTKGSHPVAVLMSIGAEKQAQIQGAELANLEFVDVLHPQTRIQASADGRLDLRVPSGSCSVWICTEDYNALCADMANI